jgi:hypothetical protein
VASSRHIVRRQTALPYAVAIDQDAKLFERLQSNFVTILEAIQQRRLDLQTHQLLSQDQADGQEQLAAALVQLPVPKQDVSTVVTFRVAILRFYEGRNGQDAPG